MPDFQEGGDIPVPVYKQDVCIKRSWCIQVPGRYDTVKAGMHAVGRVAEHQVWDAAAIISILVWVLTKRELLEGCCCTFQFHSSGWRPCSVHVTCARANCRNNNAKIFLLFFLNNKKHMNSPSLLVPVNKFWACVTSPAQKGLLVLLLFPSQEPRWV